MKPVGTMTEKERDAYLQDHDQAFTEWCHFNNRELDCPDSTDDWLQSKEDEEEATK